MAKPIKVKGRTGIFYRLTRRIGGPGQEKVYYVRFKRDGRIIEAKAGRQYKNNMTPARAERYRTNLIEGREKTPQENRERAAKEAQKKIWTVNKLWDRYCTKHPKNKSLDNEKLKYEKYLRKELGGKEPCELTPGDVARLTEKIQKKDKWTMAARVLELLRRTVNYGANSYDDKDPEAKEPLIPPISFTIKIPKLNNQTTEDLSPKQIKKLISVLDADEDQPAANVMRIALFSGMRKGEILKLKWEDISFRRGFVTLVDPKSGEDQKIPLNDAVRGVLKSIDHADETEFVFPGRFPGEHFAGSSRSFARIKKEAGLPKGFRPLHGLRHVYASMLASSGKVDLYTLQKLLTHKSPQMTQRYAHLRDDALKQASNLAGSLIDEVINGSKARKVVDIREKK